MFENCLACKTQAEKYDELGISNNIKMKIELVPTIPFMLYINFCVAKREKYAN
jgi:hypothetical protein